jgi:RHS repeat-associated protein
MNYNPLSQLSEIQRYADIAGTQLVGNTNYTYDALNRLTNLNHSNSTTNLAFYNFVYDEASRITQIENIDGTTDYTYDKRSQLLGAEYSNTVVTDESYTYDKNGNRVSSTQHGENYQTGTNNRLLSDGVYNYEYDLSGNLIRRSEIATDAVREFEWDYRNRLVAVIDKNADGNEIQRVEFTYDAMNRRIAKTVDGVVTYFVYDGDNVLLDFVDTDGVDGEGVPVLAQRYLHGAGVDQILAQEDGSGNVVWHLADHLGTIRDLVDSSGEVVNHLTYDSYGNVVAETDDTVDSRYLYTGRELDAETGLYYYRARYYDAQVGRFIGEDPISFAGRDNNLYRYVANSPLQYRDPFGLIASKEHCDELRRQIYSTFTELVKKLEKYNPKTDAQGGHQYRHGSRSGTTQPGSHYQHIKDAQQSLKRQLTEYIKQCRKDDDDNQNPPIARFVDEAANRTIESPKTNNNNPIISNELQETLLEIINGLGKGLEVTLTLIGAGAGWLWTQIVQGLQ